MGRLAHFPALSRAVVVAFVAVTWALPARAQTCGASGRPWVSLAFAGGDFSNDFESKVLADLRAGLTERGIDACAGAAATGAEPPLASVAIASIDEKSVAVSVEVRDAVTAKRVSRDIDLARVPPDGRAFAIAIAVDELVWASWAEIALTQKQPQTAAAVPKKKPPPEVTAGVESELPRSGGRASELVLRFAAEHYLGGESDLGGDLGALLPLGERMTLDLGAGLRQGFPVSAPDGRVLASAIGIGAALRFALVHGSAADFGPCAGARVTVTRLRGTAGAGASASEFAGLTAYARLGLFTSLRLGGAFHLDASLGAGAPLRALEATDGGHDVTGVSGVELFGDLGIAVEL
ncbi:MAG TPA: hypothetical protein VMI54_14100 [Polyangiaceae bacterium]|nr:hypothetical protein [Polyangiaceae bacterium]